MKAGGGAGANSASQPESGRRPKCPKLGTPGIVLPILTSAVPLTPRFAGARRGVLVAEFIDWGPLRRRAARLVLILCHRQTGYRDIRVVCET